MLVVEAEDRAGDRVEALVQVLEARVAPVLEAQVAPAWAPLEAESECCFDRPRHCSPARLSRRREPLRPLLSHATFGVANAAQSASLSMQSVGKLDVLSSVIVQLRFFLVHRSVQSSVYSKYA